jgi:hypothetical protein
MILVLLVAFAIIIGACAGRHGIRRAEPMSDVQISLTSLMIGGVLSAAISWYFFRKSVDKRLSAYIQFASPVLAGVDDPHVRKALEIRYRGTPIDDLLQLQFVIANEGQRAIRDLLEPLTLTLPKTAKLLEATLLHVEPKGREVTIDSGELPDGQTKVEFRFKLLNKGEFFFVKMLINGRLDAGRLKFSIAGDDLPPTITPKSQPFRTPDEEPTTGVGAVLLGLLPLALAIGTTFGMVELSRARPELFPGDQRFAWFSWTTLALLLWLGGVIYWVVRSVQLVVARGLFGPKQRFHLPRPAEPLDYRMAYRRRFADPELRMLFERHLRDLPPAERRRLLREFRVARMRPDTEETPES